LVRLALPNGGVLGSERYVHRGLLVNRKL